MGRTIQNYDEEVWDANKEAIVIRGTWLKFQQNALLLQKLLDTEKRTIGEAAMYDREWGIGRSMTDTRAWNTQQWNGRNKMGMVLMAVRAELSAARARDVRFAEQELVAPSRTPTIPWATSSDAAYIPIRKALLSFL